MNWRRQLEGILSEPQRVAVAREQHAFDEAVGSKRQVVLFGAGRLGRALLQGLRRTNIEAVAFTDNNPQLWGETVDGIRVLSPENAATTYRRDAVFVIAIWHPSQTSLMCCLLDQVYALGCCGVPFPVLFWRFPNIFLPYYLWNLPSKVLPHHVDVLGAFDLLADETSRQVFISQIELRLRADFRGSAEVSAGEQYFPGLFSLIPRECFVDCGAYDGDTIRSFVRESAGRFRKIIAFEADPAVIPKLRNCLDEIGPRAVIHTSVVSNSTGKLRFSGDGIGGGHISQSGGAEVPCVHLDHALASEQTSFIKMDIEGAEPDALQGARTIVKADRPVLAICSYHLQNHLWTVPTLLHSMLPDASIFMRAHQSDGFDVVCYAIPPERVNNDLTAASTTNRGVALSRPASL